MSSSNDDSTPPGSSSHSVCMICSGQSIFGDDFVLFGAGNHFAQFDEAVWDAQPSEASREHAAWTASHRFETSAHVLEISDNAPS